MCVLPIVIIIIDVHKHVEKKLDHGKQHANHLFSASVVLSLVFSDSTCVIYLGWERRRNEDGKETRREAAQDYMNRKGQVFLGKI